MKVFLKIIKGMAPVALDSDAGNKLDDNVSCKDVDFI
jgi:hypothetical protein